MSLVTALPHDARGWVLGKQLLRSATSIGANVWEADSAVSDADFALKIGIARKEANETVYWLELAIAAELLPVERLGAIRTEAEEILRVLGTIARKTHEYMQR